jgi:endoglucanase
MKKLLLISVWLMMFLVNHAQVPFHHGVNLTGWFQADNARKIQFRKFTRKDFADIKSLGCDVIRLPINLHGMTAGVPDYKIDPLFISFLDSAVNWAEELQLYLLIDNHSFDPLANTSPDIGLTLNKVWPQLAEHYKDRSDFIIYEVLNEPHGISNQVWGNIQQQAIDAIRSMDTKHKIIVGPSGYNSYNDLAELPVYTDANLIYTFHFYDPFMFTHQGASWVSPSMEPLSGVPFPYNAGSMPACPPSLLGSWIESGLNSYPVDGTVDKVKSLIDIAVNFRNARNIDIFCGEFGVYIPNSNNVNRSFWYQTIKEYLDLKGIPWTIWDYKGGFGVFKKGSGEVFESDLNVPLLEALGFNAPEQHSNMVLPDSVGFGIYDDYIGQGINDASYSSGTIDYYSGLFPNNGSYCLYWSGGPQYTTVAFDFVPDRDLSKLVNAGYAIDMLVRGSVAGTKFDVRFLDTKTSDPLDHPWRMKSMISDPNPAWDKRWHHIHIPLSEFTEQGAWDNGSWYNPEGKFDWTAIDRFEIDAEYASNEGKEIWFDNIMITDKDSATVIENGTLGLNPEMASGDFFGLRVEPNPMKSSATIYYETPESGFTRVSIFNMNGNKITDLVNESLAGGNYTVKWYGCDDNGNMQPAGIYICRITSGKYQKYCKLIKAAG